MLKAATIDAARTLGLDSSIGSLKSGKLADLLVYRPGADVMHDLKSSLDIQYVIRGGRIWEADTMNQVWPVEKPRQEMPPFNP